MTVSPTKVRRILVNNGVDAEVAFDVLEGAIDYLNFGGWVQGVDRSGDKYCLTGALFESVVTVTDEPKSSITPAYKAVAEMVVADLALAGIYRLAGWNDELGRRKTEVTGTLGRVRDAVERELARRS